MLNKHTDYVLGLVFLFPPLVYFAQFSDWYDLPKFLAFALLTSIMLVVFGFLMIKESRQLLFRYSAWFVGLVGFFTLSVFLSSVFSVHPLTSFFPRQSLFTGHALEFTLLLLLTVTIYIWLQKNRQDKLEHLTVYIVVALFLVSFSSLGIEGRGFFAENQRVVGNLGEPNRTALYLITALPLAIGLALNAKKHLKLLGLVTCARTVVSILMTQSRGAIAVGLISAALVAVPFLTSRNNLLSSLYRHKSKITWLVVGVLILYLVGVTKPITNRIAAVGSDILWRQGSIYLRVEEFGQALRAFEDRNTWRKLIGTGANTTTYFLQSYADAELNAKMAPDERLWWKNMVRNQYLQYLLDGGIITLVSFLGVFFFIYIKMFTVKNLKITELSFWVLALVFFVSGLVYYHTLLQKILFWGALGVVGSGFGDFEFEIKTRVVGLFFVLFGVFSLLFAILFGTSDFLANSGKLAQASRLVPWYDAPYRRMANVHLYRALGNKSEMDVNLGIKYATKAYSLNPWDINNINAMRAAYYRAGVVINKDYHQEAFKYAREYLAKNPAQAFGWDYLGLIYLDLGQLPEAREAFVKAVTLDPDYRGAYLHIGETFKQEGDFEQAEKYYLMAITKWPRWDFAREEMESLRELRGSDQTYD